jgi:hypothetical protein
MNNTLPSDRDSLQKLEHLDDDNGLLEENGLFDDLDDNLDFSICGSSEVTSDAAFPRFSVVIRIFRRYRKAFKS